VKIRQSEDNFGLFRSFGASPLPNLPPISQDVIVNDVYAHHNTNDSTTTLWVAVPLTQAGTLTWKLSGELDICGHGMLYSSPPCSDQR
jgi:hypothetical protein